jgi:hypothetical protein
MRAELRTGSARAMASTAISFVQKWGPKYQVSVPSATRTVRP